MRFPTREAAEAEARERSGTDGKLHVVVADGDAWALRRTNLPAPVKPLVAGRGELEDAPEDPRNFLMRQVPPYGPG